MTNSNVSTLNELRLDMPAMCIAKPVRNFNYNIHVDENDKICQRAILNDDLLMSNYFFTHLQYDPERRICLVSNPDDFVSNYRPYIGQDLNNKKLFVWRTGGFGDLLFIQPNLIYLKKLYPTCKIIFATSPQYLSLLRTWDCIDESIIFPCDSSYLYTSDYHLTFEGVIERCDESKKINSYKLFSKWMGLNIPDNELVPILKEDELVKKEVQLYIKRSKLNKYVVIQLRASSPIRTPSFYFWYKLLKYLTNKNIDIIITDSKKNEENIDTVISIFIKVLGKGYKRLRNYASYSETINHSIELIRNASAVIAPDSSMVHIAAATKTPVLGIYGAFSGNLRMETYSNSDWIEPEYNTDICEYGAKGCFLHGHSLCNHKIKNNIISGTFLDKLSSPCYDNIDVRKLYLKIDNILKLKE